MVAACPFPAARGTPVRIHRMAEALARRGHEIDVVTYHLGDALVDPSFQVHRTRSLISYNKVTPGPDWRKLLVLDPLLSALVARLARGRHYHVVHAHHVEGLLSALPAAHRYGIPLVFDAHTLLETELPFYRMGLGRGVLKRLGRWLDRIIPRRADHVIAVSERIRDAFIQQADISTEMVSVIPNGVESQIFAAPVNFRSNFSASPTLVYAGNLATYQGIDLLLVAFSKVAAQSPELRLKIVSDTGFEAYESLSRTLGVRDQIDVVQADFSRLPSELSSADVLLNPRTNCDGLPQKLLNYMAAGRPIVSFQGSARHVRDGYSALVVPDGDTGAFADAILRLLRDRSLALMLGRNAQLHVQAEMGWVHTAERVEAVYERLMKVATQ